MWTLKVLDKSKTETLWITLEEVPSHVGSVINDDNPPVRPMIWGQNMNNMKMENR